MRTLCTYRLQNSKRRCKQCKGGYNANLLKVQRWKLHWYGDFDGGGYSSQTKYSAKTESSETKPKAYRHNDAAILRPDIGVEQHFRSDKTPSEYRFDSSLDPQLNWDETSGRDYAEWLLNLILKATELGEEEVFSKPQEWRASLDQFTSIAQCVRKLKSLSRPFLDWSGKAESKDLVVPALPLFVHERHSSEAIIETFTSNRWRNNTLNLFGDTDLDAADKVEAYKHQGKWTNRLILGDSLQVMNSLVEYEKMDGQVQMIYFDPPYGVKFGSNFQPFVRQTTVSHGSDKAMSREPESVKAYRDTWELGIHSYLTYLRDRIYLASELLADSGSIFVQISDDNVHHVREILDEIFPEGFVSQITFQKTSGFDTKLLPTVGDYLLWYAKDKEKVKHHKLFVPQKDSLGKGNSKLLMLPDASVRRVTKAMIQGAEQVPDNAILFGSGDLQSQSSEPVSQPFEHEGKTYHPNPNSQWKTHNEGMKRLAQNHRIHVTKNTIRYKRFASDFPFKRISNIWTDTTTGFFTDRKIYVVQTGSRVIERCINMTTDPGDIVLDITCGSGTTPVAAEKWGRRWIAIDTSRVPIALARQRLLTSVFPWFELKKPRKGPSGGFVYKKRTNQKNQDVGGLVSRVTLKSVANDEAPPTEILVERAEVLSKVTRVCGPFTIEATINSKDLDQNLEYSYSQNYIDRMIRVLKESETINLNRNAKLELKNTRSLENCDFLHAECTFVSNENSTVAISFGPQDGAIGSEFVINAVNEAINLNFKQLFLFGFAIQAKTHEALKKMRIATTYIDTASDVVMSDLLKTTKQSQIFSITGLPDISLLKDNLNEHGKQMYRLKINGLDVFLPDKLETEHIPAEDIPCWMIDTDYNGLVFYASQVFFPKNRAWDNLKRSLKERFTDETFDVLSGTESQSFELGERRRVAVKAIDARGIELMAIRTEEEAQ